MKIINNSKLTKKMQIDFSRALFMKSFRKALIIMEAIGALGIGLVLGVYIEKFYIAIIIGLLMIAFPIASILFFNNGIKKMDADQSTTFEEVDVRFEIDEAVVTADIMFNGGHNVVSEAINHFDQVYETKDLFVLIIGNQQGFFVEKQGFLTINDCEKVGSILRTLPCYRKM